MTNPNDCKATVWNADVLSGTCVMYAGTEDDATPIICDVKLMTRQQSDLGQLRASYLLETKQEKRRRGRAAFGPLGCDMATIFGAELSAKDAVASLRRIADLIETEGLLIGRDHCRDRYYVETVDSEIKAV